VLFGSTLLGVLGALVAIPVAASLQIAVREWWDYRHEKSITELAGAPVAPPPPEPEPA
jgi:predicted PurR-regulated permease PerM